MHHNPRNKRVAPETRTTAVGAHRSASRHVLYHFRVSWLRQAVEVAMMLCVGDKTNFISGSRVCTGNVFREVPTSLHVKANHKIALNDGQQLRKAQVTDRPRRGPSGEPTHTWSCSVSICMWYRVHYHALYPPSNLTGKFRGSEKSVIVCIVVYSRETPLEHERAAYKACATLHVCTAALLGCSFVEKQPLYRSRKSQFSLRSRYHRTDFSICSGRLAQVSSPQFLPHHHTSQVSASPP